MKTTCPILLVLLLLATPPALQAQFTYTTNNGAITLAHYTSTGGEVVISNFVNIIGTDAFFETAVTSVTIPNSVTNIGNDAFEYCTNLAGVAIPASVTNIGIGAFSECSSLAGVTIPISVTSIGMGAFSYCTNLATVTIPGSVSYFGQAAFNHCTGLTNVTISNGVTSIGVEAFEFCTSLASVTIDNGVINIGQDAFVYCTGLVSVTIGTNVTSIADSAFEHCTSLSNVTIPNSVGSIGDEAFAYCASLASVTIPGSVTNIGDDTFEYCSNLGSVTIGANVTGMGLAVFAYCSGLTNATISNGVTSLGQAMFAYCALTNVTIPASVTNMGQYAFESCTNLTAVYFQGAPPRADCTVFVVSYGSPDLINATVYYLPEAAGWSSTFACLTTAVWNQPAGALEVTLSPANSVTNGAQWQVDGGDWEPSGAIVPGMSAGSHIVAFSVIPGWSTPSNETVTITSGTTNQITGVYTPQKVQDVTLTITSPKPGQILNLTNGLLTVTGMAKDTLPARDHTVVESVYYELNGGSWTLATPGNSWSNWTAGVILNPGSNTIGAYAVDTSSNASSITKVTFSYIPSALLTVSTNGFGAINPVYNGKPLAIGTNYTLTASPRKNWLFYNWVVTGSESSASTNAVLKFTMEPNLRLTANFVTNPFPAIQGTYNGLFYQTSASRPVTEQSSGFATITIGSASQGAYSAVLKVDGGSYRFSGMFDVFGNSATNIPRTGKSPLALTLHVGLNLNPPADSMTGSVFASDWDGPSALSADLAWFNGTTLKASNDAGKYTFVLPLSETPATSPGGYSVAKFANNLAGKAVLTGSLADNTTITSLSTPISKEGLVPIYYSYTPGTNVIFGWLRFTNDPPQTVLGELTWFKLPTTSKVLYSNGFTLQSSIIGSLCTPVTTNTLVTNGTLAIADPGQGIDLVYTNVSLISNKWTCATPPTNQLTATITSSTGAISLSFRPTGAKANITAQGVLLQNSPADPSIKAAGWFAGTNQTGYFILTQ